MTDYEAFQTLLKSKQKNRKKKRFFPDFYLNKGYKEQQAFDLAFKVFSGTLSPEEKASISVCTLWDKRYYLIRGFTEEEAAKFVSSTQAKNHAKRKQKYKDDKILGPMHKEYWIKKGLSEEDAIKAVKTRQTTFSLKRNIEKYGEVEGLKRWKERQAKWQKSMRSLPLEVLDNIKKAQSMSVADWALKKANGDIEHAKIIAAALIDTRRVGTREWALKKANGDQELANKIFLDRLEKIFLNAKRSNGNVSKESQIRLSPIIQYVSTIYPHYSINFGRNEFFIRDNNAIFKYDFAIPELKIIIEYHGIAWHPKNGDLSWKSPFGLSYDDARKRDLLKKQIAENSGFTYYEIWSDSIIDYDYFKGKIDEKHKDYTEKTVRAA